MWALQRSQRAIINQCFTKKVADKDRRCLDEELLEAEAKVEEDEKAEVEEFEEQEQKAEREDPITAFIKEFVSAKRINHGFRWGGDAMNSLQAALIDKGLTITMGNMKLKIKAYVTPVAGHSFAALAGSPEFHKVVVISENNMSGFQC